MTLMSRHSLAEWTSSLEELRGEDGFVTKNLYSTATCKPLHNLDLDVSRLWKSCLNQSRSSADVYTNPLGPARKRRMLSLLRLSLLEACNGILAGVEQKSALSGSHMSFAGKEERPS